MELKNFISIYDDALPIKLIGNLIRYANKTQFEKATILDQNNPENFNIRRTYSSFLTNTGLQAKTLPFAMNLLRF